MREVTMKPETAKWLRGVDEVTAELRDKIAAMPTEDVITLESDLRGAYSTAIAAKDQFQSVVTGLALIGFYAAVANSIEARHADACGD